MKHCKMCDELSWGTITIISGSLCEAVAELCPYFRGLIVQAKKLQSKSTTKSQGWAENQILGWNMKLPLVRALRAKLRSVAVKSISYSLNSWASALSQAVADRFEEKKFKLMPRSLHSFALKKSTIYIIKWAKGFNIQDFLKQRSWLETIDY